MPLEIETKYLNPDLESVCVQLMDAGATYCSGHLEENLLFDTPDRELRAANILLRLRHAGCSTLTLKKKPDATQPADSRFKILEELETAVEDSASMRNILELLGYVIVFRYEKFRATWTWQSCSICLDALPFAQVVELEGTPESIERTARRFGLDRLESSTMNYVQLYHRHCRTLGTEIKDRFLFSQTQHVTLRTALQGEPHDAPDRISPCAVFRALERSRT